MRGFFAIALTSLIFPCAVFASDLAAPECAVALLSQKDQAKLVRVEILQARANAGRFQKWVLRALTRSIEKSVLKRCRRGAGCTAHDLAQAVQSSIAAVNKTSGRVMGYSVLVGAMVGSAALTAKLTEALPASGKFLAQLVAQISTLGIYMLGAPIWEPLSSAFRLRAFGISKENSQLWGQSHPDEVEFTKVWASTQSTYGQNAQMSRNLIHQFILAAQQNFRAARIALDSGHLKFALDQIAEIVVRKRHLFADIPVDEPNVRLAVRSEFTNHISDPDQLIEGILKAIREVDAKSTDPQVFAWYEKILKTWLGP